MGNGKFKKHKSLVLFLIASALFMVASTMEYNDQVKIEQAGISND